jgi:hypothetical protein
MSGFRWSENASKAAIALAEGKTRKEVAFEHGIDERTVYRWLANEEFSAEVDRLSLMVGIASRAQRLRIAQRVIKQKVGDIRVVTDKDLLDWLKFAQSETDGIKLDIAKLATALGTDEASVAGGGSD